MFNCWKLSSPPRCACLELLSLLLIVSIVHVLLRCSPEDVLVWDPPSGLPVERFPTMLIFSFCRVWESVCTLHEENIWVFVGICCFQHNDVQFSIYACWAVPPNGMIYNILQSSSISKISSSSSAWQWNEDSLVQLQKQAKRTGIW